MRQVAPCCYSSRRRTPPPYDMARYVAAARARRVADYVVLAHDGHGVNSYAIHYFLVRQPLCLFAQVAWRGVYTDSTDAAARMKECFALASRLTEALGQSERGALGRTSRLIVVATDFTTSSAELRSGRRAGPIQEFDSPPAALAGALQRVRAVGRAK